MRPDGASAQTDEPSKSTGEGAMGKTLVVDFKILIYRRDSRLSVTTRLENVPFIRRSSSPGSENKSCNPPAAAAQKHAALQLVGCCFVFLTFCRGESLEPGEDIISRHLCIVFNGPVTSFHGPVPPGHTRPAWTGSHQPEGRCREEHWGLGFFFFPFLFTSFTETRMRWHSKRVR